MRRVRAARPFEIVAMLVLPEHLHAVCKLPDSDADYSGRWRAIKAGLAQALVGCGVPLVCNGKDDTTYGNSALGNLPCATKPIWRSMWITSTSAR